MAIGVPPAESGPTRAWLGKVPGVDKRPSSILASHRYQRLLPLYVVSSGHPQGRAVCARNPEESVGIDVRACVSRQFAAF